MRVVMLSWEYPPLTGAVSRAVAPLSAALARAGHEVTVVTRHLAGSGPAPGRVDGVRVVRAEPDPPPPAPGDAPLCWTAEVNRRLTAAALRAAPANGYQLVHAHDWLVTHAAVALKRRLGTPFVTTLQGTEAGRRQGFLPGEASRGVHSLEWWLVAEASRVLVPSEYLRWEVTHLFDVPAERVEVVPNGIDPAQWRVPPRAITAARLRFAGEGPLIVYAGRLVREKGVQDLLAALPVLRERHPGTRAVVAGDGAWRGELIEQARRLRLHRAVSFPGRLDRPTLAAVMAAADAFVLPCRYEPTGTVALEAAAAGAPLVVASTGGLASIVTHGVTGVRFPTGHPAGLADAVGALLADPTFAHSLAARARLMVEQRHSWSAIAVRTADIYGEALAQGPSPLGPPLHGAFPVVPVPPGNLLAGAPQVPVDPIPGGSPEAKTAWAAGMEAARAEGRRSWRVPALSTETTTAERDAVEQDAPQREEANRDAAGRAAAAPFDVLLAATRRR